MGEKAPIVLEKGFAILPGVEPEVLAECQRLTEARVEGGGTRRLFERIPELAEWLSHLNPDPGLVLCRSILFDKTTESNWKVGWHQDVTLACETRFERDGLPHVQPPVDVLEQMLTLRLHLDECGADNGPLRVLPGTHRKGKLSAQEIQQLAATEPAEECLCAAGEILAMRPLLIHSSGSATKPGRRRVIHLEFCPTRAIPASS